MIRRQKKHMWIRLPLTLHELLLNIVEFSEEKKWSELVPTGSSKACHPMFIWCVWMHIHLTEAHRTFRAVTTYNIQLVFTCQRFSRYHRFWVLCHFQTTKKTEKTRFLIIFFRCINCTNFLKYFDHKDVRIYGFFQEEGEGVTKLCVDYMNVYVVCHMRWR